MHYYKRNIGDYAKKAGKLTMLQHGAYTLLIDACYDRERFPTLEDAMDWAWAESDEEKQAVQVVLRRFFTLQDGLYVQERIIEELQSYRAVSEVNSRIAKQREETKRARSVLKRGPVVHESAPNQEPLTTNQVEVSKDTLSPNVAPTCPHQEILKLWSEKLPAAIQPKEWTPSRSDLLKARWREKKNRQNLDWWSKLFDYVSLSDFLMGRVDTPGRKAFAITLQWLLKAENFAKVVEGTYHEQESAA